MQRLLQICGSSLLYPDYRAGLQAILVGQGGLTAFEERGGGYTNNIAAGIVAEESMLTGRAKLGDEDAGDFDLRGKIAALEARLSDVIARQESLEVRAGWHTFCTIYRISRLLAIYRFFLLPSF